MLPGLSASTDRAWRRFAHPVVGAGDRAVGDRRRGARPRARPGPPIPKSRCASRRHVRLGPGSRPQGPTARSRRAQGTPPPARIRCARRDRGPIASAHARQVPDLLRHPRVRGEARLVAGEEVPVKRRERAGVFAQRLRRVESAALAVRAHAVEILAAGRIGLARHQAAVGVLAHAERIRQLDPLDGVDVDGQVPGVQLARCDAQPQRVQAGDHQALDVVRIAVRERGADRVGQACHRHVAAPVERRQRLVRVERVEVEEAGHARPVDPAHVFAPAEDLAHEALGAQLVGEAAQRAQEQRRARLRRRHVRRLGIDLGHPHHVARGVEAVERGRRAVELVAEHEHELADFSGHRAPCPCGRRRCST